VGSLSTRTLNSPEKRVGVDVVRATCLKTVFENMASWERDIAREKYLLFMRMVARRKGRNVKLMGARRKWTARLLI
jgi:hypothetical protein